MEALAYPSVLYNQKTFSVRNWKLCFIDLTGTTLYYVFGPNSNFRKYTDKEIKYEEIEMAEYLLPNNSLNIENARKLFSIHNRMVQISAIFSSKEKNVSKCWWPDQYVAYLRMQIF